KKYCILNKNYEKEEYFKLKEKIIGKLKNNGEWGKFLGFDISNFPYNDTLAYDYFKVHKVIFADGKVEIIDKNAKGIVRVFEDKFISDAELDLGGNEKIKIKWRTRNKEINIPENIDIITSKELDIFEIELKSGERNLDELLEKVIICEESGRPFKLIKPEIDFIKAKGFPIPRIHPELRREKLLSIRPLGQLYMGISDKSGEEILSVFSEKQDFKIYSPEEYKDFMFK
ncbi:MAG: hypothetical protein PHE25_06170, partial [Candidatus Gracilibacteria bacterium]|nr:hypothetical protein [Candidatus Gracilibacteria bacterium]